MTTIVPTSEEDPFLSVVQFTSHLAWSDAGPEIAEPEIARLCREAEESIITGKWIELANLMVTSAELVSSKISEKDLECTYTIICSLVKNMNNLEEVLAMVNAITSKIIQYPNDKASLRLKILFNLYNLVDDDYPYARFQVYVKALAFAINGKVTDYVVPSFKKIDNFLKEWNLEVKDRRELFLAIANVLRENKSLVKESLKFLTKYLATFLKEEEDVQEAKEEAVRAVIEFVKASSIFQCDLLELPVVSQLEKDDKFKPVYELLKIFLSKRLNDYREFQIANSEILQTYGLVDEECVTKMRLLSLVDLASDESGEITYASIKETLQVNEDEVELWIVKAITAKLIDCKMDQMNQVVIVSRCSEREFGSKQWQSLRTKLANWRENVANIISTIESNKVSEEEGSQASSSSAIQGLTVR